MNAISFAVFRCISPALGCCFLSACLPGSSQERIPTYSVVRQHFVITVEAEGTVEAKVSQVLTTPRLREWRQLSISYLAPEGAHVNKGDEVVRFDPQAFENDYLSALNDLELARVESQRQAAQLRAQQLTMEAEMESARAAAGISRLQLTRLEFVAPRLREVKRLEMRRDELRAEKLRKRLASMADIQKEEIAHQAIVIQQAERKLNQAEEAIGRLILTAPTAGIVLHERSPWRGRKPQEGDHLYPMEPVAKIPDLSVMQIVLQVSEIAAQKVKVGQRAEVDISSLDHPRTSGSVAQVAPRAQPIRPNSQVKQVEVAIALDTARVDFIPGLSARVRIVVDEHPDALAVPLECVFQQDSLNVVYVRQGRNFVPIPVKIAGQNADFALVEGDLAEASELALKEPEHEGRR